MPELTYVFFCHELFTCLCKGYREILDMSNTKKFEEEIVDEKFPCSTDWMQAHEYHIELGQSLPRSKEHSNKTDDILN